MVWAGREVNFGMDEKFWIFFCQNLDGPDITLQHSALKV